jgi:hypothetical protein
MSDMLVKGKVLAKKNAQEFETSQLRVSIIIMDSFKFEYKLWVRYRDVRGITIKNNIWEVCINFFTSPKNYIVLLTLTAILLALNHTAIF